MFTDLKLSCFLGSCRVIYPLTTNNVITINYMHNHGKNTLMLYRVHLQHDAHLR